MEARMPRPSVRPMFGSAPALSSACTISTSSPPAAPRSGVREPSNPSPYVMGVFGLAPALSSASTTA
eukprot:3891789-Prymnesium_polylepis.1